MDILVLDRNKDPRRMANCYGHTSKTGDSHILVMAKLGPWLGLFDDAGPATQKFLDQGRANQALIREVICELKKSKKRDPYLHAIRRRLEASVGMVRIVLE